MEPVNVFEFEPLAQARMEAAAWDYYRSGAEDEITLRDSHEAFSRIRLRPRMLVDLSQIALRTTVLGEEVSMPILIAPTAYHCLASEEGECDTARAAGAMGTLMTVSTLANRSLEEVAQAATGPLWFQLYVYRERAATEKLVRRAEAAGYRALVLTVDAPRLGRRERDIRNGFDLPPHLRRGNFDEPHLADDPAHERYQSGLAAHAAANFDTTLTWDAVAWLRSITKLPVLVKGVLTREDAALAATHGADGIIVSNHGGRQLDGVITTIEALPEVVAGAGGACEVLLDGGIRRGTDVLKALALGARAVLVGRPILWGLAVDGQRGVERVLTMLRDELELAMMLAGRPDVTAIDRSLVRLPGEGL
ncbi:MAG TPA: alpha-hydroxy acid oxidase [Ktedonobacterales bacterium]